MFVVAANNTYSNLYTNFSGNLGEDVAQKGLGPGTGQTLMNREVLYLESLEPVP